MVDAEKPTHVASDGVVANLQRITNQEKSAPFLTEIPGLPPARRFMGFLGSRGVYFDDPDRHLLEIITTSHGDPAEF